MLKTKIIEGTNVVDIQYSGSLSVQEMDQAHDLMKQMQSEHSQVKLMLEYGDVDLERIDFAAWAEDLKSIGRSVRMERMAVAADQNWLRKLGEDFGFLAPATVRAFGTDHRDEALAWITPQ